MPNALEEVTGGVPKAPTPPDIEDVLGPPPHAPHVGRRGHALSLAGRYRRPPSPPHIGRRVSSESARNAPAPPQKIVVEQKPVKPVEFAKLPDSEPTAGTPVRRGAQAASRIADMINPHRREPQVRPGEEQLTPEQRVKQDRRKAEVAEIMANLRKHQEGSP